MRVSIVGCGAMGSALAKRLCLVHDVILFDRDSHKAGILAKEIGADFAKDWETLLHGAEVVLLAIKPKDLTDLAKAIEPIIPSSTLVVSMLAGIKVEILSHLFPKQRHLRIMPNLAITYEKGVIGIVESAAMAQKFRHEIEDLFQGMGLPVFLPEDKIDALTALTGSAPAFVFDLVEAMMEGGISLGFSQELALALVLQVFEGSITLLKESKEHPAALKSKVASPGGTTIEGLKVLEQHKVHDILIQALQASYTKATQIL